MPHPTISQLLDQTILLENEPGRHLVLPETLISEENYPYQKGGLFHIDDEIRNILAYIEYLIHRHPKWPYLARRLLFPADRCLNLLYQLARIHSRLSPSVAMRESYLAESRDIQSQLRSIALSTSPSPPVFKIVRLHTKWIKARTIHYRKKDQTASIALSVSSYRITPINLFLRFRRETDALLTLQLASDARIENLVETS